MKSSIKKRLTGNFMIVILITVIILEFFLFNAIKKYYYKSIEEILSNQVSFSAEYYSRYFSSNPLEELVIDDVDVFWNQTSAQVQILDSDGNVLMDSIGAIHSDKAIETTDVITALKGKLGTWMGNVDYDTEPVIIV